MRWFSIPPVAENPPTRLQCPSFSFSTLHIYAVRFHVIKAGIVGATGYTGSELLRILARHPDVNISVVTSRAEAGQPVSGMFPQLRGYVDINFSEPDVDLLAACDVVFFATPHGVAQAQVPALIVKGARVIDLSADFRIKDQALWEHW